MDDRAVVFMQAEVAGDPPVPTGAVLVRIDRQEIGKLIMANSPAPALRLLASIASISTEATRIPPGTIIRCEIDLREPIITP
jgi:hypothetical protein